MGFISPAENHLLEVYYDLHARAMRRIAAKTGEFMSALGQKPTYALQQAMSALHLIATAKAKFRKRSYPLYPQKRT